jgi:hypothetical protein
MKKITPLLNYFCAGLAKMGDFAQFQYFLERPFSCSIRSCHDSSYEELYLLECDTLQHKETSTISDSSIHE